MNTRAFTLSLVIAGLAMFMVYTYLDSREKQFVEKYGSERAVLIASVDIKELDVLDESKVAVINIPQKFLAPGYLSDKKQIYNTIAAVPIKKNEQITEPRITYPSSRTGLSRQVSPGKRAFAITVDTSQAVSRLILPGDRVDVLAFIDYGGGRKDLQKVKTILQDVMILSTGYKITNNMPLVYRKEEGDKEDGGSSTSLLKLSSYTDYNNVTLELTPFEVQKIAFVVASGGRPYLSLRNNDDKQNVVINSSKLFDLLGDEGEEAKKFFEQNNAKTAQ